MVGSAYRQDDRRKPIRDDDPVTDQRHVYRRMTKSRLGFMALYTGDATGDRHIPAGLGNSMRIKE